MTTGLSAQFCYEVFSTDGEEGRELGIVHPQSLQQENLPESDSKFSLQPLSLVEGEQSRVNSSPQRDNLLYRVQR